MPETMSAKNEKMASRVKKLTALLLFALVRQGTADDAAADAAGPGGARGADAPGSEG